MNKVLKTIFFFQLSAMLNCAWALKPLQSIILGDLTNQYVESSEDPLNFIYNIKTKDQELKEKELRESLALYRGFLEEGVSLSNYCKANPTIKYSSLWNKTQVIRSFLTNLQYIGLDLTTRAIGKYSQYFEFTEKDHENMVDNLVGNYCSRNISVISLKALKKNMKVKFKENNFVLPSVKNNALYPKKFSTSIPEENSRENEFFQTIELFKSFCSWGGDANNLRMLVPLIRNSQVMAFVIRQMASSRLEWNDFKKGFRLKPYKDTSKVLCQGLICRTTDFVTLNNKLPRGIGSKGIADDLKRLYCEELRDSDYVYKDQAPKIRKLIKERTFDDENLLTSHFISLITNVPDLFVRSENFSNAMEFMRASIDSHWDEWSSAQLDRLSKELMYEESLTIELVDRKFYYSIFEPKFSIIFDVNLGEFDRIFNRRGKIKTKFNINLSKEMLAWIRKALIFADPKKPDTKEFVYKRVEQSVEDSVQLARYKFKIPPWNTGLSRLIAREVIYQVVSLVDDPFKMGEKGMVKIPIELHYGMFALRYIHSKHLVNKNKKVIERDLKTFEDQQAKKQVNGQK